jgi:hypothetical protein
MLPTQELKIAAKCITWCLESCYCDYHAVVRTSSIGYASQSIITVYSSRFQNVVQEVCARRSVDVVLRWITTLASQDACHIFFCIKSQSISTTQQSLLGGVDQACRVGTSHFSTVLTCTPHVPYEWRARGERAEAQVKSRCRSTRGKI